MAQNTDKIPTSLEKECEERFATYQKKVAEKGIHGGSKFIQKVARLFDGEEQEDKHYKFQKNTLLLNN